MIPVDLAKNPTAVRTKQISVADIQVDDHRLDQGLTGIGPRFPGGQAIGSCWLSDTYWNSLGANKPPRHPPSAAQDAHDYELTSILYWDGDLANRRFFGLHARILSTQGPLSRVEIWHAGVGKASGHVGAGKAPGHPSAGIWWLDLAQVAHPIDPLATQIAPGGKSDGALFLDETTVQSLSLRTPKRPPGSGCDLFP